MAVPSVLLDLDRQLVPKGGHVRQSGVNPGDLFPAVGGGELAHNIFQKRSSVVARNPPYSTFRRIVPTRQQPKCSLALAYLVVRPRAF